MRELAESHDSSELIFSRPGVWLLAFATVAAGVFDLMWGGFDSAHQPIQAFDDNIPGQGVMAYVTGVWMVAAGAAILWRQGSKTSAAALALIYLVFCDLLVATVLQRPALSWFSHLRSGWRVCRIRFSVHRGRCRDALLCVARSARHLMATNDSLCAMDFRNLRG